MRLNEEKRSALVKILGKELAAKVLADGETLTKELADVGIVLGNSEIKPTSATWKRDFMTRFGLKQSQGSAFGHKAADDNQVIYEQYAYLGDGPFNTNELRALRQALDDYHSGVSAGSKALPANVNPFSAIAAAALGSKEARTVLQQPTGKLPETPGQQIAGLIFGGMKGRR